MESYGVCTYCNNELEETPSGTHVHCVSLGCPGNDLFTRIYKREETMIGKKFCPLEDDISELVLLDKMGNDLRIVQTARTSYLGDSKGDEKDKALLFYLYKSRHMTPFRSVVLQFRIKCPLFVLRQLRTHQWANYEDVQWSWNEQSGRYVKMPEEFYISKARVQAEKNKQGSVETDDIGLQARWKEHQEEVGRYARWNRDKALERGIAKELANRLLPQNIYTTTIVTMNIDSLLNLLTLRCDEHAQLEIRKYANCMADIVKAEFPWTYEAWERFKFTCIDTTKEM